MGRRAEPDILTPREREVLALLREELSNDAIAERLGISVAGVKYHVSEILGKLGLENRADAARWAAAAPAAKRPWWAAIAPLGLGRLSGAIAGGVAIAVVAGIAVLIWALASTGGGGSTSPGPANLAGLTAETFAPRVRASMAAEGMVYYVMNERSGEADTGERQRMWTVEAWIDFNRDVAREVFDLDPSNTADLASHVEMIVVGDTLYSASDDETDAGPNSDCPGVTTFIAFALGMVLECGESSQVGGFSQASEPTLVSEAFDGTPAVGYRIERDIVGSAEDGSETRVPSTWTFYVDVETLLPLAFVLDADTEEGHFRSVDALDSELIAANSLPDGFFDPASIGYVAPTPTPVIDPLEALQGARDAGLTPYWLGEDLVDSDLRSLLHFRASAFGQPPGDGPGNRVSVEYEVVSAFREGGVTIWLWTPDEWQLYYDEAVTRMAFLGPCGSQEEIAVPGGTATVLAAHEPVGQAVAVTSAPSGGTIAPEVTPTPSSGCPDGPFDLYAAIADYGDTIVTINMPHCISCLGRTYDRDPWDSREGMLRIIAGLTVRQ